MTAPGRERLPDLKFLFPIKTWWTHPMLRTPATWLVVALVAVPPIAYMINQNDTKTAVEILAVYFAVAWFLVLFVIVRPQAITGAQLGQVIALALVLGPLAGPVEVAINPTLQYNLVQSIFEIGLPEEVAKMLPVVAALCFLHRRGGVLVPRDALFLGVVSGLVFGASEAVGYVMSGLDADPVSVVWRIWTDPVSHALWAGVSCYFLGLAARYRSAGPRWTLAGLGLAAPAVLHGVNDWLTSDHQFFFWSALSVVSVLLFLAYAKVGIAPAPPRPAATPTPPPPGWGPPSAATFERPRPRDTGRHAAP